jgi:hypothetical protein
MKLKSVTLDLLSGLQRVESFFDDGRAAFDFDRGPCEEGLFLINQGKLITSFREYTGRLQEGNRSPGN